MAPLHQAARYIFTLPLPFLSNFFNFYGTNDQEVELLLPMMLMMINWNDLHRIATMLLAEMRCCSSKYTFRSQSQLIYNFARGNSNRLFFATSLTQSLSLILNTFVMSWLALLYPSQVTFSCLSRAIHPSEGNKTIYATTPE